MSLSQPMSQEDAILIQAKANVLQLEPRIETLTQCVVCLEAGFREAGEDKLEDAVLGPLVSAIAQAQLLQLKAALIELQDSLSKSKQVIDRLESKIFRPLA